MKFRKKPIEIEAHLLTIKNIYDIQEWANSILPDYLTVEVIYDNFPVEIKGLRIPTKEGMMICSIGDYLIKEPFPTDDRMFYPCKLDMFNLTYEPSI